MRESRCPYPTLNPTDPDDRIMPNPMPAKACVPTIFSCEVEIACPSAPSANVQGTGGPNPPGAVVYEKRWT